MKKCSFPLFQSSFVPYFIFLSLASSVLSKIPEDLIPINVYNDAISSNYNVFIGAINDTNATNQLHDLQGVQKIGSHYYIYGRENIFVVDQQAKDWETNEIPCKQVVEWKANRTNVALCIQKGQTQENCKSFIKLFQEDASKESDGNKKAIVCSTNAYNPTCRIYEILSTGELKLRKDNLPGKSRCPYNPHENITTLIADGNLYTATVSGFRGQYAQIVRSSRASSFVTLRTPLQDSLALNDPQFIRFVDPGISSKKIFVFFKETAIENQSYKIYSRVGQVCKNDQGGRGHSKNQFSSFFKARLNCSLPGQPNFYFDEMSDVTDFVTLNSWYKNGDKTMVFAIMNTPRNSVPASAICAFTLENIEKSLKGSFMEYISNENGSGWYWEEQTIFPFPHLARCDRPSAGLRDFKLNFVKKHPLMYHSVSAWSFADTDGSASTPFYTRTNSKYFLTALAVDTDAGRGYRGWTKFTVLIAGTEDGKIIKFLLNLNERVLIEERTVYNLKKCTGDKSVRKIILDKATGSMMVAFESCVVRVPLCPLSNTICSRNCIKSRDPYCGWDGSECVPMDQQLNISVCTRMKIVQDVMNGHVDCYPPCDDTRGGSTIDGFPNLNEERCDSNKAPTPLPPNIPKKENTQEACPLYLYFLVGLVFLIVGVILDELFWFLLKKWRLRNEKRELLEEHPLVTAPFS